MKARQILSILISLLAALHLSAQKDTAAKKPNPFDKNGAGIVIGYSFFPGIHFEKNTYRFYISRQYYIDNNIIRLGLDLRIDPETAYKYYFSGYYLGYARACPMFKYRLWPYAGGDFLIQQDLDKFDIYERTQNRFGLAPVGGLQYRIRPWLFFNTELSYAFSLRESILRTYNGMTEIIHSRRYDFSINPHRLMSLGMSFQF